MGEALIEQVRAVLLPGAERRNIFFESRGKCVLMSHNSERKPDALAAPANHVVEGGQKIRWKEVIAPFRFKTRRLSSLFEISLPIASSLPASASGLFVPDEEKDSPPVESVQCPLQPGQVARGADHQVALPEVVEFLTWIPQFRMYHPMFQAFAH